MQEISTFVILKATSTDRQTRRLRIFKIFAFICRQIYAEAYDNFYNIFQLRSCVVAKWA